MVNMARTLAGLLGTAHRQAATKSWVFILLATFVVALSLWQGIEIARWNRFNTALTRATFAEQPGERYRLSGEAISLKSVSMLDDSTIKRLDAAYRLRWQSASVLGYIDDAISAYLEGHEGRSNFAMGFNCSDTPPQRLEAEEFDGISEGSLNHVRWHQDRLGTLMYSSAPISTTVCLPEDGLMMIKVTALNGSPPPINLAVGWDDWIVGIITFTEGNDAFTVETLSAASPAGPHILSVQFANDFADSTAGIDRNAFVDAITIERVIGD